MVNPGRTVFTKRTGRRDRFEAGVASIFEDLYRLARRLERDPVEADDLLQQALVIGLNKLDQLREDDAYRTWQSRILVNTHINRRKKRSEAAMAPDVVDNVVPLTPNNPQLDAERAQLADQLVDAIERLPLNQRLAVLLVDVEGRELGEAAEVLDIPWGTVASRLARGRATLRKRLAHVAREQGVIR